MVIAMAQFASFCVERDGALSTLFGDFDDKIEPMIKGCYDHCFIVNREDPLYQTLLEHQEKHGEEFLHEGARFSRLWKISPSNYLLKLPSMAFV